jgi:hypothetical protein
MKLPIFECTVVVFLYPLEGTTRIDGGDAVSVERRDL